MKKQAVEKEEVVFARLSELTRMIDNPEKAWDFIANKFYPKGMTHCPHCLFEKVYKLKKKHHYMCGNRKCQKKFNVLFGTIFQCTKLPLHIWLEGIYKHLSTKKGVNSVQMGKDLGISQSAAYLMIAKIQEILDDTQNIKFQGHVELDELMYGPRAGNMHKNKRPQGNLQGRSNLIKTPIIALKQRGKGGKILVIVIKEANLQCIREVCFDYIELGSTLITDEFTTYRYLTKYYQHFYCHHKSKQFVDPERPFINTNAVEGFWSFLRRSGEEKSQRFW